MRRKRIMKGTAIGLTALMVMSGAVNPALAGEAATESTSEVHFPDVYTEDLIVPDTPMQMKLKRRLRRWLMP